MEGNLELIDLMRLLKSGCKRLARFGFERAAFGLFGAAVIGLYFWAVDWPGALGNLGRVPWRSEPHASAIAQAKRLDLGYADALKPESVGKPVLWCIDHVASGYSYLAGRPSQPILWDNEHAVPFNSPTTGGRCTKMLATIVGARPDGLALSLRMAFSGRP